MPMMTDEQYETLAKISSVKRKRKRTSLMNLHCYDILRNPYYVSEFQYVSPAEADRNKMIVDSDSEEGNDGA